MMKFRVPSKVWNHSINQDKWAKSISTALEAPFCDFSLLERSCEISEKRAQQIKSQSRQTVFVGIGGSYWTPNSMSTYFASPDRYPLYFLDSPEAHSFHSLFRKIKEFKDTHFIFVSKSGSTLEPLSLLSSLIAYASSQSLDLARQSTLLCSPGSNPMREWAESNQVPILEIPQEVGGRYSSLTVVGLIASELLGFSCSAFLEGAKRVKNQSDLAAQLGEFGLSSFQHHLPITQLWTYSARLWPIGQWWQQLWSESLAKKGGPVISTPMVCCGPRDQHSLFQQLVDGERDKSVLLLQDLSSASQEIPLGSTFSQREEFKNLELTLQDVLRSEIEGFCGALHQNEIPFGRLSGDFSQIQTWGEFFMSWQVAVAAMGSYLEINPFDQPGVELGKVLSRQYLKSVKIKES